jgi:hypothetical protein
LDKQEKEVLKLIKYCQHWADHNISHKESYIKWRDVANERGLNKVAENLDKAIEMLDKCNEYLLAARSILG